MRALSGLVVVWGCVVAGCGTGGSTGDGSQSQSSGDCRAFCAALAAAGCDTPDEESCPADCKAAEELAAATDGADCEAAHGAWVSCMSTAELECNGFSVSRMPCRVEYDHFQNYCVHGFTPAEPCLDNPTFDGLCGAETPHAKLCRGNAEKGCVVGGTENHADLFCCP